MKNFLLSLGLGLLAAACITALLLSRSVREFETPFRGWEGDSLEYEVAAGATARSVFEDLERRGVLRSALMARIAFAYSMEGEHIKAGEYRFAEALSGWEVLEKLARGEVATHPLTIVEGLDLEETASAIADAGFGNRERLIEIMSEPGSIRDLDPEADSLEGYLFPDTYAFARGTEEEEIVATLVSTFRRRIEGLPREARADVRRLVTLASIVEKEAQLAEERPLIAGVFSNRLDRGIPLAADPTVIFALKLEGRYDGNIRKADLALDHPYNTYVKAGLPPGPICSPGLASLEAAASPATTEALYFVSRNDGSHVFSRTLQEHNRAVEKWQRQYWRERWARERTQGE